MHRTPQIIKVLPGKEKARAGLKKRKRRKATEIERRFICQVPGCRKSYGTEGALKFHMQSKHKDVKYIPSYLRQYNSNRTADAPRSVVWPELLGATSVSPSNTVHAHTSVSPSATIAPSHSTITTPQSGITIGGSSTGMSGFSVLGYGNGVPHVPVSTIGDFVGSGTVSTGSVGGNGVGTTPVLTGHLGNLPGIGLPSVDGDIDNVAVGRTGHNSLNSLNVVPVGMGGVGLIPGIGSMGGIGLGGMATGLTIPGVNVNTGINVPGAQGGMPGLEEIIGGMNQTRGNAPYTANARVAEITGGLNLSGMEGFEEGYSDEDEGDEGREERSKGPQSWEDFGG